MDSRSGRLPFSVSGSRSSYGSPSSFSPSSSSPSSSRLYGRDRLLSSDRFPLSTAALKPEPDLQSSRYLSSTREYSRTPCWKLPSSALPSASSTSYERPWVNSALNSRDKLMGQERRMGSCSGLLQSDDGDSKRAKLSLYSSSKLTSSTGDKRTGTWSDSMSRSSSSLSSRPSSSSWSSSSSSSGYPSLSSRRAGWRAELGHPGLTEQRVRSPGPPSSSSSLYQTDRLTSSYAQGARPKETLYSPTSSSLTRESSLSRHLSSSSSSSYQLPALRDISPRLASRSLSSASSSRLVASCHEAKRSPEATQVFSSTRTSSWNSSPSARRSEAASYQPPSPTPPASPSPPPPTPPSPPPPAQRPAEPDGRLSTRRLLLRLFSRRSGQDSSSSSSSSSPTVAQHRSPQDASRAISDESPPSSSPPSSSSESRDLDTAQAFAFLRRRRQDLTPISESGGSSPAATGGRGSGGGVGSSWLTSSLRSRCPPLFSRHRRESRDESARRAAGVQHGYVRRSLRRPQASGPEHKSSDDDEEEEEEEEEDDDDDEEEEELEFGEEGAGASSFFRVRPMRAAAGDQVTARPSTLATTVHQDIFSADQSKPQDSKPHPSRDPERLRKIQESLLLEDSDEEEGDLCRICQMREESPANPLIQPCHCAGSLQYVHQECIKKWLRSKISLGTNLEAITTCELCKEKLHLNIDNFDVSELYRTHVQSEYEFVSSGLYLVVLLHLCEQRFSNVLGAANQAGFFNLARSLHEHMDGLESTHTEVEEEDEDEEEGLAAARDNRPSIDFSDLEDDLDEQY